ncbi:MAG TPA: alpha/beta hydrolase [Sphingomicrobium sp.]|nr:alpha/beta hydrolase [Sphingomicrobium sp.]
MGDSRPGVDYLDWESGRLAYRLRSGSSPALLFLPGYASDMDGTKALALDAFAARRGTAMLRFDYSGTGASSGRFEDGTLAGWLDQALAMVDRLVDGPVVLVGSSMGGWIALHLALRRPDRVAAVVGIAAAPDFTDWGYDSEHKAQLLRDGRVLRPNPYGGEPQLTTAAFWRSGEKLRLLDAPIAVDCPVRLIHGDADREVPLAIATRLMSQLRSADVQLNILKGGGHRLSEPREIEAIVRTVAPLLEPAP